MTTRHISYAPLGSLRVAKRNPKDHDLPSIIASLRRFGWVDPAVVDERTGLLLGGHGRREGAIMMMQAGDPPPTGVFVDDDGDWLVPVLRGVESRNDTEAEALIIALNSTTEAGGWIERTLAAMLEDVVTEDAPLVETMGLTYERVDEILARVDPESLDSHEQAEKPSKSSAPDPDPHLPLSDEDESVVDATPTPDLSLATTTRTHTCPECGTEFED